MGKRRQSKAKEFADALERNEASMGEMALKRIDLGSEDAA